MKFHVLFKTESNSFNSQGETFEGTNVIEALGVFFKKYPTSIFLSVYSLDEVSHLLRVAPEISHNEDIAEALRLTPDDTTNPLS